MKAEERRELIRERIVLAGAAEFSALAQEFQVSEMTIRRDMDALESQGGIRRVPRGAIAFSGRGEEPPFRARALNAVAGKAGIARGVVQLLQPGESVILDSGSTALAVARAIRGRELRLTVVTPSLLVALELVDEPDTTVLIVGGQVRAGELSLIGAEAEAAFALYHCDTYVMGIAGLDSEAGATEYHREEAFVKRSAIRTAGRVVAAVDASKLDQVHLMTVAGLESISVIVTDGGESRTLADAEAAGVQVVRVARDEESA